VNRENERLRLKQSKKKFMLNKNISKDKRKIWREDQMRMHDKLCME